MIVINYRAGKRRVLHTFNLGFPDGAVRSVPGWTRLRLLLINHIGAHMIVKYFSCGLTQIALILVST